MTDTTEPKSPAREAAELLKLELEAEKLRVDTETARIEQEQKRAEARRVKAAAQEAEHDAYLRGLRRLEAERTEDLTKVSDFYNHVYVFDQPVSQVSVNTCLNVINTWHRLKPDAPWEIVMNSPGGSVVAGMHLFDQLAGYSERGGGTHKITMTVRGYAASMAGILLQAADVRRIGRESYLMIHEISAGAGGKIGEIKDDVKWYEKVCERIVDIFVERSNGKITAEEFKKGWERIDWWIDSKEALERGFVDKIG